MEPAHNCAGEKDRETLREFAYAVAHGVRGSSGQVRTLLAMLLESLPPLPDPEILNHLNTAVSRLGGLSDALAACSDSLNWSYQFQVVNSADVLGTALIRFEPWLRSGDLVVTNGELPEVRGDRARLADVFDRLIDNALKFRVDGPARMTVEARQEGARKIFSVRDNGIGIDIKHRDLLFRPCKRLWGERYPGSGIGLFICKQIVEAHGGRIWLADPQAGGGAQFEFFIPA